MYASAEFVFCGDEWQLFVSPETFPEYKWGNLPPKNASDLESGLVKHQPSILLLHQGAFLSDMVGHRASWEREAV